MARGDLGHNHITQMFADNGELPGAHLVGVPGQLAPLENHIVTVEPGI